MMADRGSGPATAHGGRLIAARRAFPDAPSPFLDLSTGISPRAYPFQPLLDSAFTRLPEPEQENALRRLAAMTYGAPGPDYVALAPGSQMLISLLPAVLGCREAAVLGPTYAEHRLSWQRAGVSVVEVATVDALAARAAAGTALVLCNPNNPDGRMLDRSSLSWLADRCGTSGATLVIDEAYADLEPDAPLAARLQSDHNRVVALRSFGKSFGLAGLRLGMLLAHPAIAFAMRDMLGPWPVGGPAIEIGLQALANIAWRDETARRSLEDRHRLERLLENAGLDDIGGTRLFRLARTSRAATIWLDLARAGILVRRFDEHSDWLRFGLPPDEAGWQRLATALRSR